MIDQANRTFICSVVFVDLVGYSKKSVAEQISVKERFQSLLAESLKDIAVNERIILDTGDGAAMSFLGDPEDALFVAMNLRDAMSPSAATDGDPALAQQPGQICIGINLGPVKLVRDINGHPNIIGDGINVAQRIMSFAKPGQVVVSRSYFDVVSVISDAYAKIFHYEGSRTDKHVREHEIYIVGQSDDAFKQAKLGMENRAAQTNPRARAQNQVGVQSGTYRLPALNQQQDEAPPAGFLQDPKKIMMASAALGVIVLILIAVILTRKPAQPASPTDPAAAVASSSPTSAPATTGTVPPAADSPKSETPAATTEAAKPVDPAKPAVDATKPAATAPADASKADPTKTEPPKVEAPPGTVNLAINPWGEVFVNGRSRGVSPPMKNLKLAPGKYRIEIKNTTFPTYTESIEVKSREELTIRHKF